MVTRSLGILDQLKSVFLMTGVLFHVLLCVYMFRIFSVHFNFILPYLDKLQISDDIESSPVSTIHAIQHLYIYEYQFILK